MAWGTRTSRTRIFGVRIIAAPCFRLIRLFSTFCRNILKRITTAITTAIKITLSAGRWFWRPPTASLSAPEIVKKRNAYVITPIVKKKMLLTAKPDAIPAAVAPGMMARNMNSITKEPILIGITLLSAIPTTKQVMICPAGILCACG